jgi:hypothetical protein
LKLTAGCSLPLRSGIAGASQEASAMAVSASEGVGQYDLLIVGPGVLGRIVAERWQQVNYCFLYPFF